MKRDCAHINANHKHGTINAYVNDACRCTPCKRANADRAAARRKAAKLGTLEPRFIDATASRRYLESLRRAGWPLPEIARRLGYRGTSSLENVYEQPRIAATKAQRIQNVHEKLINETPATGRGTSVAKAIANKRGAVHAYAWHNIEDPDETIRDGAPPLNDAVTEYRGLPLSARRYIASGTLAGLQDDGHIDDVAVDRTLAGHRFGARLTAREVVCIVHIAARHGLNDNEIAELFGPGAVSGAGVQKIRERNGIATPANLLVAA